MSGYNDLYPKVPDRISKMCKEHLLVKAPVNAGCIAPTAREIIYNVRFGTKVALRVYGKRICTTCAYHNLWVAAGGYASYIAGRTKKFSDVDLFVNCSCPLKVQILNLGNVSIYVNKNVVSMELNTISYQIIQVPFNIASNEEPLNVDMIDMFASHVLANFDLPLCRVAVRYSFLLKKNNYLLDLSAIEYTKEGTKQFRIEKYRERRENLPLQPPSLKALTLFNMFKQ